MILIYVPGPCTLLEMHPTCFRSTDSKIPLLLKSEIRSFKLSSAAALVCSTYLVDTQKTGFLSSRLKCSLFFQGGCRRLTCPMLTAPYYGSCERVTERTNRLRIVMQYRIDPLWTSLSDIKQFDLLLFAENTIRHFENGSGLASKGCTICTHRIRASHEVSGPSASNETSTSPAYFVLRLTYVTDGNCAHGVISKRLRALVGTNTQIAMPKGQSVKVYVSLERRFFDDVILTTSHTFTETDPDCPPQTPIINLSQSELCPVITLTNTDYTKLMNKTKGAERKRMNELFGIEEGEATVPEQVQGNVTVCLDDYRAIFVSNSSSTVPVFQLVEICTATALLILCVLSSMI